jgi:hypothetical protein
VPALARWLLGLGIVATFAANVAHGLGHGLTCAGSMRHASLSSRQGAGVTAGAVAADPRYRGQPNGECGARPLATA